MLAGLLLSLTACSGQRQIVRTETVEVKVPVYVPLPGALTALDAEPPPPPRRCTDPQAGLPTVCNKDAADYLEAVRAWGRAGWGRVADIGKLQPAEPQP